MQRATVHAVRFIRAGKKITISYQEGGLSSPRRISLRYSFDFDCGCNICSLPTPDLQDSDHRRSQIQDLHDAISDPVSTMIKPGESLADCRYLLQILEEEYKNSAAAVAARLYYDTFQISIIHSDQARAGIFAERAYKLRVICEGEDSLRTRKMKQLMEDPARHWTFVASRRWETDRGEPPRGLDDGAFDKWLWRQGK